MFFQTLVDLVLVSGQDREQKKKKNTIVHSFNRNFAKRADGNPNTFAFVGSPELVTALTIAGDLNFDPQKDYLTNKDGQKVLLDPPIGEDLPRNGFSVNDLGYQEPAEKGNKIQVIINQTLNGFSYYHLLMLGMVKILLE